MPSLKDKDVYGSIYCYHSTTSMPDLITVTKGESIYAFIMKKDIETQGARFFTKDTMPFQVGLFERPAGYHVKAHQHPPQKYDVGTTSEFLYIEEGTMHVTIFDEEWNVLREETLAAGDAMLALRGGHEVKMLEPVRFYEVKQGPFPGDAASKVFRPSV